MWPPALGKLLASILDSLAAGLAALCSATSCLMPHAGWGPDGWHRSPPSCHWLQDRERISDEELQQMLLELQAFVNIQ